MNITKKGKLQLSSLAIITTIVTATVIPIVLYNLNLFNTIPFDEGIEPYLFLDEVNNTSYSFWAIGECYTIVEIEDVDFTSFMIDSETYQVSHGLNIIPMEFPNDPDNSHQLQLDPQDVQFFKTITIEPLILAENEVNVSLDLPTGLVFKAGGPITILTRIDFSYNWLRAEIINKFNETTVLKRIHDTAIYPEIDPRFYCLFMERGTYIQFDVSLDPGEYTLLLQGNGSIEFKILVNSDWDEDYIKDVEEIQKSDLHDFNLEPTIPDIWGFYEKSDANLLASSLDEEDFTEGYFSFYIPEYYINNTLFLRFNSGEFKEIVVDTDSEFFKGEVFTSNQNSPSIQAIYGPIRTGWHHISYQQKANFTSDIEFILHNVIGGHMDIKILQVSEFKDTDGDGVKDIVEYSNSQNPAKADTDEDGIADNLDSSPLAKLELDPNQIHQFILSTDESKDTLINIQIKKPENDYSTNGVPRLWRGKVNSSIYPVLRLFGNVYEDLNNPEVINILDKQALEFLWGKDLNFIYKSDDLIYNEDGAGDPLPGKQPDSEFFFIFPKTASGTFDYDIMIPREHRSKDDGIIDLRFDVIWLLTYYDFDTKETSLLHYYDFEESIIVQSMTMREISSVQYTLGNPDNFIENQILWTLTQNPSLGSFEDYGVTDDVELSGIIDYFKLPAEITKYRTTIGYEPNQSEVLYMKGFYKNYDILNQIRLETLENPDFETIHQGNYSACFSSFAISNLYEDKAYFLGDPEIQGETKILYQFYSSANDQQSTLVMGIPIAMERSTSNTLEISQIQGFLDPLEEIPWDGSQLNNKTTILHQTYIEQEDQMGGIPLVHFEEGIDIYKEYIDNRQNEVELSHQFFTSQPEMPAELFMNYIEELWENMAQVKANLSLLYDFVINNSDYFIPGAERVDLTLIESMINEITEFQQLSYSELSSYNEFFQFSQNFHTNAIELIDLYEGEGSKSLVSPGFFKKLSKVVKLAKLFPKIAKLTALFSKLGKSVNDIRVKDIPKQNSVSKNAKHPSLETQKVKTGIKSGGVGVGCVLLGVAMVIFAIIEIHQLASSNSTQDLQGIKALGALGSLIAGVLLFSEGVLLVASAISKTLATSLEGAIKSIGKITLVLAVFMYALNLVRFVDRVKNGEDVDIAMEVFQLTLSTASLVVALVVAAGFTSTGIGAAIGALIAAASILVSWVNTRFNAPDLEFSDACQSYFPGNTQLNMRRNGGLEKGDHFNYYLKIKNTGESAVWMQARLKVKGDGSPGKWTPWLRTVGGKDRWNEGSKKKPFYLPGQSFSGVLSAEINEAAPNLKYQLQFQADWRKFNYYLIFFTISRKELVREDWTGSLNMHALENTISDFYDHTTDYGTVSGLKRQYQEALEEYRYWDACETADLIIQATEVNQKISLNKFEYIQANSYLVSLDRYCDYQDVYRYQTSGITEWEYLLNNFYKQSGFDGWAARSRPYTPPDPDYSWGAGMVGYGNYGSYKPDTLEWNLASFEESEGLLFTNADPDYGWGELWMENKLAGLSDAFEYRELKNNLTLKSNLSPDLDRSIEYNSSSVSFEVSYMLNIDPYFNPNIPGALQSDTFGTDATKIVDFKITAPDGYSISPQNNFTGRLDSTINFTLVSDTPTFPVGVNYFNVSVFYEDGLIYKESVPFKVSGFSLVEFETYTSPDPIVPGQFFNILNVINSGTLDEVLKITIEGIPENFICKDLYPEKFVNGSLFLGLHPGDNISGLLIKPPRHHTTIPGQYFYKIHIQDYVYNKFNITIEGMFEVAEFYDMSFECITPDLEVLDYQKGSACYYFNVTNLGNAEQIFQILYDDITFANECLSEEIFLVAPGESKIFYLLICQFGWGVQNFSINASSIHNSQVIEKQITIIDDDIDPPQVSNFEIISTPTEIFINFDVINEAHWDDYGLSEIKVFIDDELVLIHAPLDIFEAHFSFTFNALDGDWFTQPGTHDVRVEITDNDDDVPNDALTSIITGTFEIT